MAGFVHGIRIVEAGVTTLGAWPAQGADFSDPVITTPAIAHVDLHKPYKVTLAADRAVTFEMRSGADTDDFTLAGAELTLPAQAELPPAGRLVCRLRAVDPVGNYTDFEHQLLIAPSDETPSAAGILDFSDPTNSALQ
ncbi:hypothetical protein [Sphingomonas morindae]|uniref:Uncharacterized protein n=1 Tax=Sphingomonas morindae TaxID=1541170 RepID=A0ABY4X737_9SPHN|nr:hypothetical protein [Sphingomonas morindae]USI72707.1 hypothetical protein LHA26_15755 [Sphingomonas morindae]